MAEKATWTFACVPARVLSVIGVLLFGVGLALVASPALGAPTTHFRSIGTAADYGTLEPVLGNGTQVSVTLGSDTVTGVGGTAWSSANRGRGDRVNISGVDYTIRGVESETVLTLTRPYAGATGTVNYVISRKFTTLEAWVNCIEGFVACEGVSSSSLVADDRVEVGIAYKDSAFVPPNGVSIPKDELSITTDATHDITLTADPGNRHYGVPGAGVLIHNPGCVSQTLTMVLIEVNHFTLEWMEVRDSDSDGVHVTPQSVTNHYVIRNNLITYPNCSFAGTGVGSDALDLDSNVVSVMSAEIYNNVISQGRYNVIIDAFTEGTSSIGFFNNTVYNCGLGIPGCGLRSLASSNTHIRLNNNIFHSGVGPQMNVSTPHPSSGNNITGDATATQSCPLAACFCPAGGCQINVALGSLSFVDSANDDFHILSTSAARGAGTPLGAIFTTDIDGQARSGSWDVGVDEFGAVGCCSLSVSEGAGTVTVTAASSFEMTFDANVAGGAIATFNDLAEDPSLDLAGSLETSNGPRGLHNFGMRVAGTDYNAANNMSGARLDVLEATPARVRVRPESFYQNFSGGPILAGVKGVGDYTVYGNGRVALSWERQTTLPVTYDTEYAELVAHYFTPPPPPLDSWVIYRELGAGVPIPPTGTGSDVFLMAQSDVPGARTDFLQILYRGWTAANGYPSDADLTGRTVNLPTQRMNAYWYESTATLLPAGSRHTWDSLTYFKPTSFVDDLDPAVTSRRDDYRTPAVPYALSGGGQWQDANENTSGAGDFFNESEAAYVFDMTPAATFLFDIAGSVANPRYSPFFKIRQWRSLAQFPTVTFEGALLQKDVDYRAAVKPVARGLLAQDLLWYSTFESPGAVGTPAVGNGAGTVGSYSMTPGRYGNGVLFNNALDDVRVILQPGIGLANIELDRGRIEFWYKPNYAHTDNVEHYLFDIDADGVAGNSRVRMTKESNVSCGGCPNALTAEVVDATGVSRGVTILSTSYGWQGGDWVHLALEWDSTDPTDNVRAYLDDAPLVPVATANGVFTMEAETIGGILRIGNRAVVPGCCNADGIMDEFRIYSSPSTPQEIAHGGLPGDSREKLANPSPSANVPLALQPVDAFSRGAYLFFGFDSKPRGLNVSLATPGAGVADDQVKWFFWDGAAWQSISPNDETSSFKQSGTIWWSPDWPGWAPYSLSAGPDLYYLMARLDPGSAYTTTPVESRIMSDILLFQYCGDITDVDRTFVFSPPPTTSVELMSFDAAGGDGTVELSWETGSELGNLGFHAYRGPSSAGPWTRMTPSLIPGLGSSPIGASYSWTDTGLVNGTRYYYRLEDIDTASVSTFHGPVSAVPRPASGGGEEEGEGSGEPPAPAPGTGPTPGEGSPAPSDPPPPGEGETPPVDEPEPVCSDDGRCLYGSPGEPTLRVLSRTPLEVTVELHTPGFSASPDPAGVLVDVASFASPTHAGRRGPPLQARGPRRRRGTPRPPRLHRGPGRALLDRPATRRRRRSRGRLTPRRHRPGRPLARPTHGFRSRRPPRSSRRVRLHGPHQEARPGAFPPPMGPGTGTPGLLPDPHRQDRLRRGGFPGDRGWLSRTPKPPDPQDLSGRLRPPPHHRAWAPRGPLRGRLPPCRTTPAPRGPASRPGRVRRPGPRRASHRDLRTWQRPVLPRGPAGRLHRLLRGALLRPRAHLRGHRDGPRPG